MMSERRYSDEEVREIFEIATTQRMAPAQPATAARGLTLAEIQSIGREVGLAPEELSRAAAALDARPATPVRHSLGLPIAVARTVPLPRPLADREWEQLVTDLRTTFGAHGRMQTHGNLRVWSNGRLHACVEPDGAGWRLRLGTVKSDAAASNGLGMAGIAGGVLLFVGLLVSGDLAEKIAGPLILGGSGTVALIMNALRLPRWADRRRRQMDYIAERAGRLVAPDTMPAAES